MSRNLEQAGVTGKWKIRGVPHKGWTCEDTKDLRDDQTICEMCEAAEIRYAHYMSHPDYAETLVCGVVCAGHMSGDYSGSQEREAQLHSNAGKRRRWLSRRWKQSQNGNEYINFEGFNIVIFERRGRYSFRIKQVESDEKPQFATQLYTTEDEAKLAAFDALVAL
jgi:hypothetical protein